MSVETGEEFDAAGFIEGVHVVVFREHLHDGRGPRMRRRTYFNLPAAQKALDRARERGGDGEIVLCQLQPITGR
ncbi:hypothetical protein GCM10027591_03710 [Zhihengliuella somnathii]